MLAKLSPAIFDYLDIFILSLEEQNIPKPLIWEWVWFGGSLVTFVFGGHAIKTSRPGKIQIFGALTFVLGLLPILWGKVALMNLFYTYALSIYRSQNVLCGSKFFEPAQKFDCIYCLFKNFCAGTKTNFTECKSSFCLAQNVWDCHNM